MREIDDILKTETEAVCKESPEIVEFFRNYGILLEKTRTGLKKWLDHFPDEFYEDIGIGKTQLIANLMVFLEERDRQNGAYSRYRVESVTIIGGRDKSGAPENFEITLHKGSITSIVGPTGSGKSRLLADIEWMAQADTPTLRKILINGLVPDPALRFSPEHKLVAQLSQNMNFVMDANVADFVGMHAEARGVENPDKITAEIIARANSLAGEGFGAETPLTSLSGGQSRALMIADTAFLSASAVVLIDEIENAGIDRQKALELLTSMEKIVLMATHDPILALMAQRRLVISGGGIKKVHETTILEKENLVKLEAFDKKLSEMRDMLRRGETLEVFAL